MTLPQAKDFVGSVVSVRYVDRNGFEQETVGYLMDVEYVPMYGTNLTFDFGDVGIEKVVALARTERKAA